LKKVFIIAEIAQAHEGSLGIAHSYIDILAECGVDAVKFQTHIAEAESSEFESFRVKFSYEDETRFDYWKRMEFSKEQWQGLKEHCDNKGIEFISSPFSCAAVDLLEQIGVKRYKIGSGEMTNFLMLNKIANTGKPIILSSGMSDYKDLEECIEFLKPFGNEISLLQCTTAYPTKSEQWGLSEISELKSRFNIPVGYSDHSSDITAGIAAVSLGAEILEFHVTFHKGMFGPDAKASLTIEETKQLVQSVKSLEIAFNSENSKSDMSDFSELKNLFGKSLSVNKNLLKGHIISIEDLESKKPGDKGIAARDFLSVMNKKVVRDIKKWEFLSYSDLEN
jgi:N,N'-diacetyllegionaminate synthase